MSDSRFDGIRRAGGERYAEFLKAGYREWYSPGGFRNTPYLLQKRFDSCGDKLFFIDVWCYEPSGSLPFAVQVESHFDAENADRAAWNVTLCDSPLVTPEYVERFFMGLYCDMRCVPYESSQLGG